jgi:hypothetical protein
MDSHTATVRAHPFVVTRPAHQAFELLRMGFSALPIIAGVDKFFGVLASWDQYVALPVMQAVVAKMSVQAFLQIVGIVEIAAGVLVAVRPRLGAYVVAFWLFAIVINLLLLGAYYDVALRDLGLMLGAIALGRLSENYAPEHER